MGGLTVLAGLNGNLPSTLLPRVVLKLMVLDDACRKWQQDPTMLSPQLTDCRPESEPTMQQYGHRRVFPDHEGCNRTYEPHVSVSPRYRIHLRVVPQASCLTRAVGLAMTPRSIWSVTKLLPPADYLVTIEQ